MKVVVPYEPGHRIEVRYAGSDPVVYVADDKSCVEVALSNLDDFLAAIVGSYVYVPPASSTSAKSAPKET
jgi:hypothetical protein